MRISINVAFALSVLTAACSSHPSPSAETTEGLDNATVKPLDSFDAGALAPPPGRGMSGHGIPFPGAMVGTAPVDKWAAAKGTPGELFVADALALCTLSGTGQPIGTWVTDAKLRDIRGKMSATLTSIAATGTDAGVSTNDQISASWVTMRVDSTHNFDPISQAPTAMDYTTQATKGNLAGKYDPLYNLSLYKGASVGSTPSVSQTILDVAEVNLCMARTLNQQIQYGGTLLMAGSDQRIIEEAIRERAQIAMLQLSDIAVGIANIPADMTLVDLVFLMLTGKGDSSLALASLAVSLNGETTGPNGATAATITAGWAADLVESARIEARATEKLQNLLVRSAAAMDTPPGASAPTNRCGAAGGPCDDLGPGSWRQRAAALLYGGDPLDAVGAPGVAALEAADGTKAPLAWPTAAELPYATHAVPTGGASAPPSWTPGAIRFMQIAQRLDSLSVLLKPGVTTYSGPSDLATASTNGNAISDAAYWLYLDMEAAIQNAGCASTSLALANSDAGLADAGVTITCTPITAITIQHDGYTFPVTNTNTPNTAILNGWQAWQTYELRPEDAQDLVNVLASMLPSTSARGGLLLIGGTDVRTLPGHPSQSLHFATNARLITHSALETASVYARMGRHHLPQIIMDSPQMFESVYGGALDGHADGTVLDADRSMGAIPAFAELREALSSIASGANPAAKAFQNQVPALSALVTGAVGATQVSLLPVETKLDVNGQTTVVQSMGPTISAAGSLAGTATRKWYLRILPPAADTFWSDSLSEYAIYAIVDKPQSLDAVLDPSGVRSGFTSLPALLAAADGSAQLGTELVRLASGELSTVVNLPENVAGAAAPHSVVFVAQHRAGHTYAYQALSGALTPWAVRFVAPDKKTTLAIPGDAQFLVTGGSLVNLALQAVSVNPLDPATPLYDGFGNPANVLPTRAQLTVGGAGTPPPPQYTWWQQTLALADAPLRDVSTAWNKFIGNLNTGLTDQVKMVHAEQTEFASINKSLVTLCGGVASNASDAGAVSVTDAGVILPAAGCDISFVTISSLGPTAGDMQAMGCPSTVGAPFTAPTLDWPMPTPPSSEAWLTPLQYCAQISSPGVTGTSYHDQAECAIGPYDTGFAFPVEVALPVACAAYTRGATFGNGTLGEALSAQAKALWAYRDSVTALDQAGLAFIAQASASDAANQAGYAAYAAEQKVAAAANQGLSGAVQSAMTAVSQAQTVLADKTAENNAIQMKSANASAGTIATYTLSGAGAGAAVGTAFGPVGTAVGAVVGAVVGAIVGTVLALTSGPSAEQIQQAQDAVNEAQGQLNIAQTSLNNAAGAADAGAAANAAQVYAAYTKVLESFATSSATLAQGTAAFTSQMGGVLGNAQTVLSSSIAIHNMVMTTALDIQLAQLTYQQVLENANVDFGIMAEFDSNLTFDLQAALDDSRSKLIDAKHLLDFTYGARFSSIPVTLGSTAAPNIWIDQVYDYDLSPLRAYYGSVGGTGPIDGTKLSDYYNTLAQLNVDYQTAYSAQAFTNAPQQQLIAGPAAQDSVTFAVDGGTSTVQVPDLGAEAWQVLCPSTAACVGKGSNWCQAPANTGTFGQVCNTAAGAVNPALGAKVTFALDSWGYLVPPGNVPHETVGNQGTYGAKNGRFSRVAVNIVSAHGAICVTNCPTLDSVNYTLTQLGPYVTSDFAGKPHFLPAPSQIGTTPNTPGTFATQLVNGVAPDDGAERSVPWNANDPINIDAYMRSDFVGLPMSGTYELDLWPTQQAPQDFGEVTAVQLVIEPYFWTATPPAGAP